MLERVAVHQTRLRTPGLTLDGKGVALGSRGLVLLASLERLVAFLVIYASERSLDDILRSLTVEVVVSKLRAREVTLTFAAESSDRMDRVAEVARLVGGFTFTGTSRHFVQFRDAAAPFGYDVGKIVTTNDALTLHHTNFSQGYSPERSIDVRALLLRLNLHIDPKTRRTPGVRWIVAESGLGRALIHYFVRSGVYADVGIAEWPAESSFSDTPIQRYVFRVADLPGRMSSLFEKTPGFTQFLEVAPGAAVEVGFRHPINLRACPLFSASELVLFRGSGLEPLELRRLPALGPVEAFARLLIRSEQVVSRLGSDVGSPVDPIRIGMRVAPDPSPSRKVTATLVRPDEIRLFRSVAYALGRRTLERTSAAVTRRGLFLRVPDGAESIPVGQMYAELGPHLFVALGYSVSPSVSPEVLFKGLGSPTEHAIFIGPDGVALGVPTIAFVPLETLLLEAQAWTSLDASPLDSALDLALDAPLTEVRLGPVGVRPLRDFDAEDA